MCLRFSASRNWDALCVPKERQLWEVPESEIASFVFPPFPLENSGPGHPTMLILAQIFKRANILKNILTYAIFPILPTFGLSDTPVAESEPVILIYLFIYLLIYLFTYFGG